jgi:hypothetical protein
MDDSTFRSKEMAIEWKKSKHQQQEYDKMKNSLALNKSTAVSNDKDTNNLD